MVHVSLDDSTTDLVKRFRRGTRRVATRDCTWRNAHTALVIALLLSCIKVPLAYATVYKPTLGHALSGSAPRHTSSPRYFPLLQHWTQASKVGSTEVQITYLDPSLLTAALGVSGTDHARIRILLKKFPRKLAFRLALTAKRRSSLGAQRLHMFVVDRGHRTSPANRYLVKRAHFVYTASGGAWREVMFLTFANVDNKLLPPKAKYFDVRMTNDGHSANLRWPFVHTVHRASNAPDTYVDALGWVLLVVSVILVYGLWATRTPKERAS